MKSFRSFVTEHVRMTTRQEIATAVAIHKKAGEIVNPVYVDLKSQAGRVFGKEEEVVRKAVLAIMHRGERENRDPALNDIYWDLPGDQLRSLGKLEKTLKKIKPEGDVKAIVKQCEKLIADWKGIQADLVDLKGKVVKITQKREEAKAVKAKETAAKFADSSSLIKIFESHLNEYKDMAHKRAKEFLDTKITDLKNHGWDLNKIAPRPSYNSQSRTEYQAMMQQRSLFLQITKPKNASTKVGDPTDIRVLNKAGVDHYINAAVVSAEAAYRSFMHKMITKIGKPVVEAEMSGNIWTNAILTVKTNDGETQRWKTKMILNFSKYQLMFNQFPTTKMK